MVEIFVNGKSQSHLHPMSVAELLQVMALMGKKVAVERNGEIVPRASHAKTLLANGDRLEIVVAVGGG